VARASLQELLEDYRDFLRVRRIPEWTKEHPYVQRLRYLNRQPNANYDTFKNGIEHSDPAIAANVMPGWRSGRRGRLRATPRRARQSNAPDQHCST
jgi:hypothetical protein